MKTRKEESLEEVISNFEEMADLVLHQLNLLNNFMTGQYAGSAEGIISSINENELRIDRYEVIISEKFINSIVLFQPVASDIRKLVSIYRIMLNLERIGDLVLNIIDSMKTIRDSSEFKAMSDVIINMLMSGRSMVEKSLLSFTNNDNDYAIWTIKNDEVVDEMNRQLLINSISKANVSDRTREMLLSYIDLKNIITNLERIADHATNIAEASIYSIKGDDIRHNPQLATE